MCHKHHFLLFAHKIHKQSQAIDFVCVLRATLSATVYDVFFQDSLSQYSKVLQQQEVIKVGRRPVNICCNYSLVMRIVSIKV